MSGDPSEASGNRPPGPVFVPEGPKMDPSAARGQPRSAASRISANMCPWPASKPSTPQTRRFGSVQRIRMSCRLVCRGRRRRHVSSDRCMRSAGYRWTSGPDRPGTHRGTGSSSRLRGIEIGGREQFQAAVRHNKLLVPHVAGRGLSPTAEIPKLMTSRADYVTA
jgi:hypothetical protein